MEFIMRQTCIKIQFGQFLKFKSLKDSCKSSINRSIFFFYSKTNKQSQHLEFGNDLELEFKESKINEEDHEDTKPDSWKMLTFWNWKN